MIKIKIHDPVMGKNRISFAGFLMLKDLFRDYSIDITDSDDLDYIFLGAHTILNKGISLQEAADIVVHKKLKEIGGSGGIIAVDSQGNFSLTFNTEGMYRGSMVKGGKPVVSIYKNKD